MTTYIYQDPKNDGSLLVSLDEIDGCRLVAELPYTENKFFGGHFGGEPVSIPYDEVVDVLQENVGKFSYYFSSAIIALKSMKKLQT